MPILPSLRGAPTGFKLCCKCQQLLPLSDFGVREGSRYQSYCKPCYRVVRRLTPDQSRVSHLRKTYGISPTAYLAMLDSQGGVCAICGGTEKGLDRVGRIKPLCVDHNHKSGKVRGLLCDKCNQGIGCFRDDPFRVVDAVTYLVKCQMTETEYNIKQIAQIIGMNERLLRNYLEEEGIRSHLSPIGRPPRFSHDSLEKFRRIAEQASAGTTSPKKLAAAIRNGLDLGALAPGGGLTLIPDSGERGEEDSFPLSGKGEPGSSTAMQIIPQDGFPELSAESRARLGAVLVAITHAAVEHLGERAFPAPEDRLLNLKEAHEETGLPLSVIRTRIPAVTSVSRNRRWKRSVLRQFIADL